MRRASSIVSGFDWHECFERTTTSDSTGSMCALSYSTTPSFLPEYGGSPSTGMIELTATPGAIGSDDSTFTNGLPGVMLSTAVGAPRVEEIARASLLSVAKSVTVFVILRGMLTRRAPCWASQLPAT